ncbi:MAG: S8 family serine peptidase [Actinobacteria bacterium]|nr:S8 family serine peptidase [Actinomycetota bacterium]
MKGHTEQHSRIGRWLLVISATLLLALSATPTTSAFADSKGDDRHEAADDLPLGSMYHVVDQIGARQLWQQGITGAGVNVALIDTGFAPVQDLLDSGRVVQAVDLSAESGVEQAVYVDNYGHGTHMAGIIAGRSPGVNPALAADHPEWFLGVAPDAQIVSVKVADNTGGADISQVIAGVDWVVDHNAELNVRVINLSYASGSALPYNTDPLTYALERAWNAGIVVVVAAGNDGRRSNALASPALDPYVIAVGAVEAKDNGGFKVPVWASAGDGVRNPDLAAPGAHIDSLRAPLSRIDIEHPEGYVDEFLFRGSGSSQAAAVVSGAAALLIDSNPNLQPDQVKALLTSTTSKVRGGKARQVGSGLVQVDDAVAAGRVSVPVADQNWAPSDGSGLLEAARGPLHMVINDVPLVGEYTVLGAEWKGTDWPGTRWADPEAPIATPSGVRWSGGSWMGVRWSSAAWTGVRWSGVRWSDLAWDGVRWSGVRWSGGTWDGVRWSGVRWSSDAWSAESWTGVRWSGTSWTDATFAAAIWDGVRWSGVRWSGDRWDGVRWSGVRWSDVTWDGVRWSGVRWSGVRWSDGTWSGLAWAGGSWG